MNSTSTVARISRDEAEAVEGSVVPTIAGRGEVVIPLRTLGGLNEHERGKPADDSDEREQENTTEFEDPTTSLLPQSTKDLGSDSEDDHDIEDLTRSSLRRIAGPVPFAAFLISFIELSERFSFYGSTVCFTNFVQFPLPNDSPTGAGKSGQSGALGLGQRASAGIGLMNSFWAYFTPVLGAVIADSLLGRFNTICWAVLVAIVGHLLLVISASPSIISSPSTSLPLFTSAIIVMGSGTGAFKSNISPLIAEQVQPTHSAVKRLPSGERVIVDPSLTLGRVFMIFYLCINVGALAGQLGMVYAEKYYGYQTAFGLPTLIFLLCPIVLFVGRNRYVKTPPTGSVLVDTFKFVRFSSRRLFLGRSGSRASSRSLFLLSLSFLWSSEVWERSKPSKVPVNERPGWIAAARIDDAWVEDIRRGLSACKVFLFYSIYWLTYGQMGTNLISQAAVLDTKGLPNDLLSNIDPLAIIILIPVCDKFIYPWLEHHVGIRLTAIKKITMGFVAASVAMAWSFFVQRQIYSRSSCGRYAASCEEMPTIDVSVFVQIPAYLLIAISEILASVTGLEFAFTMAPKSMKSLVTSLFLFQSAISSALGFLFLPLSGDPLLDVNYAFFCILSGLAAITFYYCFRHLEA